MNGGLIMFCPKCGEKVMDDTTFCGSCGAKIKDSDLNTNVNTNEASSNSTPNSNVVVENENIKPSYFKKDNIKYIVTVGIILALIISIFAYKNLSSVNSSKVKVAKNFMTSIAKGDYEQFKKSFYKSDSKTMDLLDLEDSKSFDSFCVEMTTSAEDEFGKNWIKDLLYEVTEEGVKISQSSEEKDPLILPILYMNNKYYVDIKKLN